MRKTSKIDSESLDDAEAPAQHDDGSEGPVVAGFVPFPAREGVVTTNEMVGALREIEGI